MSTTVPLDATLAIAVLAFFAGCAFVTHVRRRRG